MKSKLSILTEICREAGFSVTVNEFGKVTTANYKPMNQINREVIKFFSDSNNSDDDVDINETPFEDESTKFYQSICEALGCDNKAEKIKNDDAERIKNEMKYYIIPFENITQALKEWGKYILDCYGISWFDEQDDFITVCQCIGADRVPAADFDEE